MKRVLLFAVLLLSIISLKAQDANNYGIKFSGFVKYDAFYDTRQTVNSREGHFVLYPDNVLPDVMGVDYNATPNINMLAIQSRLKGTISGPDAFGAKTSGLMEADFFGNSGAGLDDVNGFRLRHATVKLSWTKFEILAGQFWNPMFITDCFPGVVTFNTGAPFNPFSRNPQSRFTHKLGALSASLTAYTQRDFQSTGPAGGGTSYIRNSGIPTANFQIQIKTGEHVFGLGADYKTLKPRLYSEITLKNDTTINLVDYKKNDKVKYKVDETVSAYSAFAYAKIKLKPITLKVYGIYAQNATDLTMLGGYAVKEIANKSTGESLYLPLSTASAWGEIITNGKKLQFGLFAGYTKNMGAGDSITSSIYARNANIDNILRISPRIVFISEKVNIAFEPEYTTAIYGIANANGDGLPIKADGTTKTNKVANIRCLFSITYNF